MKNVVFFGDPNANDYETILDQFSGTKINSLKTSSIPLVQFWKDTDKKIERLLSYLKYYVSNAKLYFEYPTKSYRSNKSSMTDLMIEIEKAKIAIEAKYIEYRKTEYEKIKKWNTASENRKAVLNHWISIIRPFSNGINTNDVNEIPYQFLHRTASACYNNKRMAHVIYQVFYDKTDKDLDNIVQIINDSTKRINPNEKLKFHIWKVNAIIAYELDIRKQNPFVYLKKSNIYTFEKEEFENVV